MVCIRINGVDQRQAHVRVKKVLLKSEKQTRKSQFSELNNYKLYKIKYMVGVKYRKVNIQNVVIHYIENWNCSAKSI